MEHGVKAVIFFSSDVCLCMRLEILELECRVMLERSTVDSLSFASNLLCVFECVHFCLFVMDVMSVYWSNITLLKDCFRVLDGIL